MDIVLEPPACRVYIGYCTSGTEANQEGSCLVPSYTNREDAHPNYRNI